MIEVGGVVEPAFTGDIQDGEIRAGQVVGRQLHPLVDDVFPGGQTVHFLEDGGKVGAAHVGGFGDGV